MPRFIDYLQRLESLIGYNTQEKILVIESDDWGSIRMSSISAKEKLRKLGHPISSSNFHEWDGLETNQDIECLVELLDTSVAFNGSKAKMTLNNSTANPDFTKIKSSQFECFFRQPFDQTYETYRNSNRVIENVNEGVQAGVFEVQFHGAEHLQVNRWIKALRERSKMELEAFDVGVFSPAIGPLTGYSMEYMDALDYDSKIELDKQKEYLKEGFDIFTRVWGNQARSFIAPCYRWSKEIEKLLSELGILYIQGQRAQLHPKNKVGYKQRKVYHFTGERNRFGQIYTVRNVTFEPSLFGAEVSIKSALNQIKSAFFSEKPAIVSSHRINYTSRLSEANRNQGISSLKSLLKSIIKMYPDVIFMGSSELGDMIRRKH